MEQEISQGKTTAIVAHITIVGCIIAIFMNQESKNSFARFYIRQAFGIHIIFHGFALFFNTIGIPYAWAILYIIAAILWFLSFIGIIANKKKELSVLGPYFQKWFTFIQ